jgi:putative DNA primase/helicase
MNPTVLSLPQWLTRYQRAGFSFFNSGTSEKKCVTSWKQYQSRKPEQIEIDAWLRFRTQNYGIICGEISNLVVFDVDTKNGADPTPFLNRGLYEVRTPSGGYHFYTTYDPLFAETKHKKKNTENLLKFVDVQTNGSLVFAPPSSFNGKPYLLVNDVLITPLPEDLLLEVVAALEPEKDAQEVRPYTPPVTPETGRPGDIFNALASWDDVLIPLGWSRIGKQRENGMQFWRRPGKKEGISASTNYKGYNLFFPYTTHYNELTPQRGYTKFRLLAHLKYSGDYRETARALVMENYRLANRLP